MNVVVPAIAATVAALFEIPQAAKVALVAMAVSPVPPILPGKELKFGGRASYVFGLLVAVSITAIVLAPLTIEIMGRLFQREAYISAADIAKMVGKTVLLPLAAGLLIRQVAPDFADWLGNSITRVAFVLLIAGLLPVLYKSWPGVWALIGDGTFLAIAGVVVAAVAAGHFIGGPGERERTALGITSAMRHPGIALSIATTNFPDNNLVPAAIVLYVLVAAIVTTLYGKLRLHSISAGMGS